MMVTVSSNGNILPVGGEWLSADVPAIERATPAQRRLLLALGAGLLARLPEDQRFVATLVGVRDWVETLDKWEAHLLINRVKEAEVARSVLASRAPRGARPGGGIDKEGQTR